MKNHVLLFATVLLLSVVTNRNLAFGNGGCQSDSIVNTFTTVTSPVFDLNSFSNTASSFITDSGIVYNNYSMSDYYTPFYQSNTIGYYSRIDTIYDTNLLPIQITTLTGTITGWQYSSAIFNEYNSTGNIISTTQCDWNGQSWDTTSLTSTIYDSFGRPETTTVLNYSNNTWSNVIRTTNDYQGGTYNSKLVEAGVGLSWINEKLYEFTYSSNQRDSVRYSVWDTLNSQWSLVGEAIYQLNDFAWTARIETIPEIIVNGYTIQDGYLDLDTLENTIYQRSVHFSIGSSFNDTNVVEEMSHFYYYNSIYQLDSATSSTYAFYNNEPFSTPEFTEQVNQFDSIGRLVYSMYKETGLISQQDYYHYQTFNYDSLGRPLHFNSSIFTVNPTITDTYYTYPSPPALEVVVGKELLGCVGDSVQSFNFVPTGCAPVHCQWTPNTGLSNDTVLCPVFLIDQPITYTIQTWNDYGDTSTTQVNVGPYINAVLVLDSVSQPGTTIITINGVLGNPQYVLLMNGLPVQSSTSNSFTITTPGMYQVQISANGCYWTSGAFSIQNSVTNIIQAEPITFSISPVPTAGIINLLFESGATMPAGEIKVLDFLGRTVNSQATLCRNKIQLDVSELIDGIYFLHYTNDFGRSSRIQRFIIKK